MLNKFEQNKAKELRDKITKAQTNFIYEPNMSDWMEELEIFEVKCEHEYDNGICIFCGKEEQ